MDHGGWYDRSDCSWKAIMDVVFVGGMGLPSGGRSSIPQRLQRHFHVLGVPEFSGETYTRIYTVTPSASACISSPQLVLR
jgi:dynein heavy chain